MKKLIIYYTEDKRMYRVVQPSVFFDGNYEGLAQALAGTKGVDYYKYIIV